MVLPYNELFVYKAHKTFNALILGINQKRLNCFVFSTIYLIIATALLSNKQSLPHVRHTVSYVMP